MPRSGQDVENGPSLFVKGDLPVIGAGVREGPPETDEPPTGEPDVTAPARLRYPLSALFGLAALVAVALLRIASMGDRLPATPLETRLVDAAFPLARLSGSVPSAEGFGEWVVRAQLGTYAAVTGAFGRYADVLGGARELAVVLCAVLLVAVVVVLRELRTPTVATAIALALLVVCEPAITALATLGPGLAGAAWSAVGAALVLRSGLLPRIVGAVAGLVGLATAPLLAVPLSVLVAASTARRWAPAALVALSFGAAVLVVGVLSWSPGATLWPAVVGGAVLLAAGVVRELDRRTSHRSLRWRLSVLVGVMAVLAVALAPTVRPATARPSPHLALAGWIRSETDPATTVSVPDGVRSDLLRDGVPAARLAPDGMLVVSTSEPGAGTVLARFGTLAVSTSVSGVSESAVRAAAGEQLTRNPDLDAPADVLAAVRTGRVDTRLLVVLAGLAGRGLVLVTGLPAVAGEDTSVPRHRLELAGVDAPTTAWLRAQQPPFAPVVTGAAETPSLNWPLPAPTALLGR